MTWKDRVEITNKSAEIAIFILTAIYVFIFTPISMYSARKLWQLNESNVPFVTKRHAKIVISNVIIFNIYPTIVRPITDLGRLYRDSGEWSSFEIFLIQLMQYAVIFICIRMWLLFYDYTLELQRLNQKWTTRITKKQNSNTWTIKHRWMGNPKIVTIIAFTIASVAVAIIVILGHKYLQYTNLIPALYIIFIIIMMIKIHKCRDEFSIRKEFFVIMLWFIGCVIVYLALIIPLIPPNSTVRVVALNIFTSIGSYIVCLISTHWVIRQYQKEQMDHVQLQRILSSQQDRNKHNLSLESILSKEDGFDLFAAHLVKEFSIENLTFVFEVMQIKNDAINNGLITKDDAGLIISMPATRVNTIRRRDSYIYTINELKKNVEYVVEQYIYQAAEYCVNVSSFTRIAALNLFNELDKKEIKKSGDNTEEVVNMNLHIFTGSIEVSDEEKELISQYVTIFDKAMEEISSLLKSDSLSRFYRSNEYKLMIKDIV